MKKNYTSPKIKLIKVNTENVMAVGSVNVTDYNGNKNNQGIGESTSTWDGSEFESAKDNGGNDLWDNED